jgi:hypothetical protein
MIREFAKLFELTVREIRAAAIRIERQSWAVMRARMHARRYCKRYRRWRRRLRKSFNPTPKPSGPVCDWEPRSFGPRLYWVCRFCDTTALRPTTVHEQQIAGHTCPARKGYANAANGN